MKKIKNFFLNPIVISLIGLILFSLLVWFGGPQIKFGDGNSAPLESPVIRLVCIMVLVLIWGLNNLRIQLMNNKHNKDLVEDLEENQAVAQQSASSDQAAEELHQINQRFTHALQTLKKLKFRGKGRNKALYELPWYIIVGPPGAGKTTALVNSSLDFPLAEQFGKGALQGVGGTRNCDWWFTNEAVLVDTAGRYTTQDSHRVVDSSAWEGFLNLLKRNRRRRPINGVIVAISLHDLLIQTEEERIGHAKVIRTRLDELMERLEIRFPIYLMFTKADLVSGFSEFFEDLSKDEREQVWGVSLPNAPKPNQNPDFDCLGEQLSALTERLYDRVLWRLHQERDSKRRGAIQGFPQQMENLNSILESFVRQTFIKNRFKFQPYLRGVYFSSGTQDGTPIDRMMSSVAANFGFSRESAQAPFQQGKSFFLGNLFREVIFPESELVGSNVKYETFIRWAQRAAYVGMAAVTVGILLVWTGSITRHNMYMSEVESYVEDFNQQSERIGSWNSDIRALLPTLNALAKASIVYDQEEHPWLSGMGLYNGQVDREADKAYETQLRNILLPKLIDTLEAHVRQGHRGGDLYNTFRTYMMFNKIENMETQLVSDWFTSYWEQQFLGEGTRRKELEAHLQSLLALDLEASELNSQLIAQTQTLLLRVPVSQRIYSRIRTNPDYTQPIDMLNYFGESVRNSFDINEQTLADLNVPYMFTIEGYESIDLSTASPVVANIVNERWVLSDDDQARVDFIQDDLDEISEQVKDDYLSEYLTVWQNAYDALSVRKFSNIRDANEVLSSFVDPVYSPLLAILQTGLANTQLSSPALQNLADDFDEGKRGQATSYLADKFEGTKVDVHFREINILLRDSNNQPAPVTSILQQVRQLRDFMSQINDAPDAGKMSFDIAKARYQSGAVNPITSLKNYAKSLPQPVRGWLDTLSQESWKVILQSAHSHVNSKWRTEIYQPYNRALAGRYPLSGSSSNEVALFDFSEFFKPGGKVDVFYQEYLSAFIDTNRGWSNRTVDDYNLGFSQQGLRQVQRALTIKNVFFRNNAQSPGFTFELQPLSMERNVARFTLEIGDGDVSYNHGPKFWKTVTWSAADENKRLRLVFEDLDRRIHSQSYTGPWSWFRLQDEASLQSTSQSNVYRITFKVNEQGSGNQHQVVYELKAKSVNNPFGNNLLGSFRCPESI